MTTATTRTNSGGGLLLNAYTITTAFICIALLALLSFTSTDASAKSSSTVLSTGHSIYLSILSILVFIAARYLLTSEKQGNNNNKQHHRDTAKIIGQQQQAGAAAAEEDLIDGTHNNNNTQSLSQKLRNQNRLKNNRTTTTRSLLEDDEHDAAEEERLQLNAHAAHCQQIEDLLVSDHDSSTSCFVYTTCNGGSTASNNNNNKLITTTITSQQQQQNTLKDCVGVHTEKGRRGYMEDAVAIYEDDSSYSLYSVFDGHGGRKAAIFAAHTLHKVLISELRQVLQQTSLTAPEFFNQILQSQQQQQQQEDCDPASTHHPSSPTSPSSPLPTSSTSSSAEINRSTSSTPVPSSTTTSSSLNNATPPSPKTPNYLDEAAAAAAAVEPSNKTVALLHNVYRQSFEKVDKLFLQKLKRRYHDGSTAVSVLLAPQLCIVAHIGDSRAVLAAAKLRKTNNNHNPWCEQIEAIALSIDHKPNSPGERKRIKERGGFVVNLHGTYRVNGLLATSRAFGDAPLKPVVSCEPDITITAITRSNAKSASSEKNEEGSVKHKFLVVASDGLFESMDNQAVVQFVYTTLKTGSSANEAANELVHEAIARGSTDNVSAIVILL